MEHLTSKHTDPVPKGISGHPELESASNVTRKFSLSDETLLCAYIKTKEPTWHHEMALTLCSISAKCMSYM
jgi:hypothetical protein